eukprot:gene29942-37079_t
MVAGYDENEGPSLFYVDDDGTCVSNDLFCVGSGAPLALSILDSAGDSSNSNDRTSDTFGVETAEYKDLDRAVWAVRHASARDGYSGGWINVVVVNNTGVFHVKRIDS